MTMWRTTVLTVVCWLSLAETQMIPGLPTVHQSETFISPPDIASRPLCDRPLGNSDFECYSRPTRGTFLAPVRFPASTAECRCTKCPRMMRIKCAVTGEWFAEAEDRNICNCAPCNPSSIPRDLKCDRATLALEGERNVTCRCRLSCQKHVLRCKDDNVAAFLNYKCYGFDFNEVEGNLRSSYSGGTWKYSCFSGFELRGAKNLSCIDGELSGEVPTCHQIPVTKSSKHEHKVSSDPPHVYLVLLAVSSSVQLVLGAILVTAMVLWCRSNRKLRPSGREVQIRARQGAENQDDDLYAEIRESKIYDDAE